MEVNVRRLYLRVSLIVVLAFMLTIAVVPDALCWSIGFDYMPSTTATIELGLGGLFNETVTVNGPTMVYTWPSDTLPDGRNKSKTQILSMNLVGNSSYIGPITVVVAPLPKVSNGTLLQLSPGVDFPANSSFDVYIEIQTVFGTFHNDDPVFMSAIINEKPPWGTNYTAAPGLITLRNATDYPFGLIKHVSHVIGPKPIPVGGFSVLIESTHADRLHSPAIYVSLVSMIAVATIASSVHIKRGKRKTISKAK